MRRSSPGGPARSGTPPPSGSAHPLVTGGTLVEERTGELVESRRRPTDPRECVHAFFAWWMAAACTVGLGIRLIYVFVVKAGAVLQGDAFYYHFQAYYNLQGRWFVDPSQLLTKHPVTALVPSAEHPPLWTMILTFADLIGLKSVDDQLVLVCLIGTATILLTGLVAKDLVTPRTGVIAAVLAALYPGFWVFDGEVMSEATVMLLVALTILVANRCFRQFTVGRLILLALLTGLCALTRAELVLLVPLVALPTVFWQHALAVRRRIALCGLAVLVALVPMLPWFAHNFETFHHPVLLSDQLQVTIAAANNAADLPRTAHCVVVLHLLTAGQVPQDRR